MVQSFSWKERRALEAGGTTRRAAQVKTWRRRFKHGTVFLVEERRALDASGTTRRAAQEGRAQILRDFDWLAEREDENGFRLFLKAYEIEEGTEQYETAFEAWRERLSEKQQRRSRF